ncbi:calcium channel protein [Pseudomonas capeferrum]|uniref:cache domain-containing protein n=1 Tax=Pseudomonas capeferrum TaxID=1495066 RepID=UPI0015E3FEE6|nr:cache domain-containing protein [Pseudomonas capeferrum]MBA1204303.1 calcium channel protein [Pseudomonas capeferrum]
MGLCLLGRIVGAVIGIVLALPAWAVEESYEAEDREARALLKSAAAYYHEYKAQALPVFSRQGPFIRDDHYVYVLDSNGVMLASGGPSASLIGSSLLEQLPDDIKQSFEHALSVQEQQGVQEAEYRWTNWQTGRVERKRVLFQRVDDVLLGVGYYISKATPAHARALLDKAVSAITTQPEQTLSAINSENLAFLQDDLYVFVVDLVTSHFVAHGYNPRLIGTDFRRLKDPTGKPVGVPILAAANQRSAGEYDYQWLNPLTHKVEQKHTYFRRVGNYLVAVGYYERVVE